MITFPCTLCGSRNWPRPDADCELCRGDDEGSRPDPDAEYDDWKWHQDEEGGK